MMHHLMNHGITLETKQIINITVYIIVVIKNVVRYQKILTFL